MKARPSSKGRILVVEDENIVAMDIERSLLRLGYEVVERASRGAEAIQKTADLRPDLILMDIRLKGEMTGVEAAAVIGKEYGLPIVFLTAYADDVTLKKATAAEPYGYLLKPFEEKEMHTVIEVARQKHRSIQAASALSTEALRKAEASLDLFVRSVKDCAIYLLDLEGRILTFNDGGQLINGYQAEEVIGHHFSIFHPSEAVEVGQPERALRCACADGTCQTEGWHVRRDGSRFWAETSITALRDHAGEICGFGNVTRDVTHRREAEQKLRESEALYRGFFEQVAVGVAHVDLEGRFLHVNERLAEIVDLTPEEMLRLRDSDITLPEDRPGAEGRREQILNGTLRKYSVQKRYIRREGAPVWVNISISPVGSQIPPTQLILVIEDITERKIAEAATAHLASLVDSADDAIISKDLSGAIQSWNFGAEHLFGYDAKEVLGKSITLLFPPERLGEEAVIMERIRKGELVQNLDTVRQHKSGAPVYVSVTISPIRDRTGKIVGCSKIARDISYQKKAERELQELNATLESRVRERTAQLQASNEELEQFAYVASHDLQEPLRMVASYTQLLAERYRGQLDEKADKFINYAVDGARRMQGLIQDLLRLSRVGHRGKPFAPVDVRCLLQETIKGLEKAVEESHAEIRLIEPLPEVIGDRSQLGQLFQNLIENAIKFRGKARPVIEVSARRGAHECIYSVRDNGIGIAPEFHKRVFTIFQRLHQRSEYEGNGMGLALARKIVERHGGRIWIESEAGEGTCLLFSLPERSVDFAQREPKQNE